MPTDINGPTRQQLVAEYAAQLATIPGTYQGSAAQYRGMDWKNLYLNLAAQEPGMDPLTLADDVLGLAAAQGIATGVGGTVGGLGNFVTDTGNAGAQVGDTGIGHIIGGAENAVGAITSVPEFLSRLTSVNTWIRVGEFVLGALLILSGALTLTGKNGDIPALVKTAAKVVK